MENNTDETNFTDNTDDLDSMNDIDGSYGTNSIADLHTVEHAEGFTRVICPRCGSAHIEFVTEYHRCVWLRLAAFLTGVVSAIMLLNYLISAIPEDDRATHMVVIVMFAIICVCMLFAVWMGERKTHVQGVCRDCGNIWYMN